MIVQRPKLNLFEKLYFPALMKGMAITLKHFMRTFYFLSTKQKNKKQSLMDMTSTGLVTMQYPEEKWTFPEGYRGMPTLIKDEEGREKCVSCQLCEFICPPKAIAIQPGEIHSSSRYVNVEKAPKEFNIDMLRCIYCGLCQEVCPEEAIFLKKEIPIVVGYDRKSMVFNKGRLYALGGEVKLPIKKWANK